MPCDYVIARMTRARAHAAGDRIVNGTMFKHLKPGRLVGPQISSDDWIFRFMRRPSSRSLPLRSQLPQLPKS